VEKGIKYGSAANPDATGSRRKIQGSKHLQILFLDSLDATIISPFITLHLLAYS
jgi:hypothetical protein